jgi:pimeloyl-ACP methyl ester carboxylesterase
MAKGDDREDCAGASHALFARAFRSPRHTTQYWEAGPSDGPLMIFVHGWPEIGLLWRAHMEAFASLGWRCVAPDMRGYGGSSVPARPEAYALQEIVDDMVELHTTWADVRRSGSGTIGEALSPPRSPRIMQPAAEASC